MLREKVPGHLSYPRVGEQAEKRRHKSNLRGLPPPCLLYLYNPSFSPLALLLLLPLSRWVPLLETIWTMI